MYSIAIQTIASLASWVSSHAHIRLRAFRRWLHERRTTVALQTLDDAALKDIGVRRCEIPSIAHETWVGQWRW
jgi:uncharacterized protein YjiS (DUF1127 family)